MLSARNLPTNNFKRGSHLINYGFPFIKIQSIFTCELLHLSAILYFCHMSRLYEIKDFIEWKAFGVCAAIGERLGVATSRIRLWFIYISFLTLGSPIIVYMVLAFWMNMKRYILMTRRNPFKWL